MQNEPGIIDYTEAVDTCLQDLISTTRTLRKLPVLGATTRNKDDLNKKRSQLTNSLTEFLTQLVRVEYINPEDDISENLIFGYLNSVKKAIEERPPNLERVNKVLPNLKTDFEAFNKKSLIITGGIVHKLTSNLLNRHLTSLDNQDSIQKQFETAEKSLKSLTKKLKTSEEHLTLEKATREQFQLDCEKLKQNLEDERLDTSKQADLFNKEIRRLKDQVSSYLQYNTETEQATDEGSQLLQKEIEYLKQAKESNEENLEKIKKELSRLENIVGYRDQEILDLKKETIDLRNNRDYLNEKVEKAIESEKQLLAEVTHYKAELEIKEEELTRLGNDRSLWNNTTGDESHSSLHFELHQLANRLNNPENPLNTANMGTAEEVGRLLSSKLGELFSREEKKTIPIYKGAPEDLDVAEWLREAERVARNNEWSDEQKLRFFSDRLKGDALEWHLTYTEGVQKTYKDWSADIVKRFRDTTDVERLKTKLQYIKQKPDMRMKAFITKVDSLYDSVYGKLGKEPEEATQSEKALRKDHEDLRTEEKKKIIIRGLLPKYRNEYWARMPLSSDKKTFEELLLTIENAMLNKELNEEKPINVIITESIKEQASEIEDLRKQIKSLTVCTAVSQEKPGIDAETVANVNQQQGNFENRSQERDRSSRDARNRSRSFENRNSLKRKDFSRSRSRERSSSRGRENDSRNTSKDRDWRNRSETSSWRNREVQGTYRNFRNKRQVHFQDEQYNKEEHKQPPKGKLIDCYYCGKLGHISKECRKKKRDMETRKSQM